LLTHYDHYLPASTHIHSPKDSTHFKWILWASFILTINAGFINTITLHTLHAMPSAHVTGIVARASSFVANGEGWEFLQYMVSYVCFVVGACTGGCLINYETFCKSSEHMY